MWQTVLNLQKQKKYRIIFSISLILFLFIYFLLDDFNGGYQNMKEKYGTVLVIVNIIINIFMSLMSAWMISLSSAFFSQSGKEGKGTILGSISIFFGMLTYGCTSCVIAFFATIGITFSVAVLPFSGLPYKLISLIIVIIGFFWLKHEITHSKCKIKY